MSGLKTKRVHLGIPIEAAAMQIGMRSTEYEKVENQPNLANAYLVYCICKMLGVDFNSL